MKISDKTPASLAAVKYIHGLTTGPQSLTKRSQGETGKEFRKRVKKTMRGTKLLSRPDWLDYYEGFLASLDTEKATAVKE